MKRYLNFGKSSFILVLLLAFMSFTGFTNYFAYSSKSIGGIKKISLENERRLCIDRMDDCEGSVYEEEGLCIDDAPSRALGYNVEIDDILSDLDGDLIDDIEDIDDDNDGIVDATESPNCFYTADDFEAGDRSNFVTVTSGLNMNTNYNDPQELADGDAGTTTSSSYAVNFNASQSNVGRNIYTFQFDTPVELAKIYLQYINGNSHFINGSVVKLQGSHDGSTWVDLSTGETYNQTNTNGIVLNQGTMRYQVFSVTQNSEHYPYYRIRGVSGTISSAGTSNEVYFEVHPGFNASLHPKGTCIADTDNDGTVNHQDLDSDGDGCSDSYEVGAITSETANHQYSTTSGGSGDANADGLADVVDDGSNGGTASDGIPDYEYIPFAYSATLNFCIDTDNDGESDITDIDDDNDGITDDIESSDCFYTAGDYEAGDRSSFVTVSTGLNMTTTHNDLQKLVDGDAGTAVSSRAVQFENSQSNVESNVFTFQFEKPIELSNIYLQYYDGNRHFFNGAVVKLQGSKDGISWIDLNPGTTYNQSGSVGSVLNQGTMYHQVFSVTQNSARYHYYRIKGVSGTIWSAGASNEVYFEVHSGYHASLNPRGGSCTTDTDADGILNHHDLDSDGDGCSDSYEAGAIASEIPDHQYNTSGSGDTNADGLADEVDDGSNEGTASDGIPDYIYTPYAYLSTINFCTDTDNDGEGDLADIDDDNDGIVDATESPDCFYTKAEANQITSIATDISSLNNQYISFAIDGDPSTYSKFAADVGAVGDVLFHITPQAPIKLDKIEYDPINWGITNSTDRAKLQGYNGAIWEDLTGDLELTATTGTVSIENTLHPNTVYSAFRLIISAASNYYAGIIEIRLVAHNYNASLNPKTGCTTDIDNDNTLNHLDLDSDGDGCSDSYEAGAIASETANHQFNTSSSGDANADGLADVVDDGSNGGTASDGIPDYIYTPYAYSSTLNLCENTDNDGKGDLTDIDDDNDGIVDATESPSCFYIAGDFEAGDRSSLVTVTTGLSMNSSYNTPQELVDGDAGTTTSGYAVNFINGQSNIESNIYTFQFEVPIELANIYVQYINGYTHFYNGAVVKLQGSNNGNDWVDLNAGATYNQSNTNGGVLNRGTIHYQVFSVTQNSGRYDYYRIKGVSGTIWSGGTTNEVYFEVHSGFHASLNPKENCISDKDGDGILNHQDLDSDGDGCSDSYEAGAIASESANHQYNTSGGGDANADGLADVVDDGSNGGTASDGIPDYSYTPYAYSSTLNLCKNTDNDGNGDLTDIDDDNDGIVDATESPDCFYTAGDFEAGDRSSFVTVTTGLNMHPSYNTPQKLVDGDVGTSTSSYAVEFLNGQSNVESNVYTFQFESPVNLASIYLQYINSNSHFYNGAVVKLQGSNDGNNWVDLNTGATYNQANTYGIVLNQGTMYHQVFSVTQNSGRYYYYRIKGESGGIWSSGYSNEVYFEVHSEFRASLNPKDNCGMDVDYDGILNHHDLDSDGNGCSDSYEAGAITSETTDHQFDTSGGGDTNGDGLADIVDDGSNGGTALDGIPDYEYTPYAYEGGLNLCADTDDDGIKDLIDLDDDNDGILDTDECTPNEDQTKEYKKIFDFNDASDIAEWTNYGLIEAPKHSTDVDGDVTNRSVWTNSRIPSPDNSEFITSKDVGGGRGSLQYPLTISSTTVANFPGGINRLSFDMFNAATSGIDAELDYKVEIFTENGTITLTGAYTTDQKNTLNGEHNTNATVWSRVPGWITMEFDLTPFTELKGIRIYIENIYYSSPTEVMALDNLAFYTQHDAPICNSDVDNDGIPNHHDLDSDGDGCPDALEGGGDYTSTDFVTSSIDGGNAGPDFTGNPNVDPINDNLGNTVDGDGVPVIANGGQSVGSSEMKDVDEDGDGLGASCDCFDQLGSDTDGDGVPDYADIDSDNDGLSDAVENPNNADPALNTDGDLIPNYRDSDSDNDGLPDAIEACDGVDYAMLSECRLPFDNTAVDSDGCQTGVTTSPCDTPLNTDAGETNGDSTPDYLDLDSDADGCSDSQESFGIEVTGTNISTYDGSISVDGSTGLTTSIMCNEIATADENKNGLLMYRDTDENICVYPNRDFGDLSTNNNRYAELYARQYADANNDFKPEGDSAVWLGSKVDFERWYQSSLLADGDDNDAEGDDDDGLEITVPAPNTGTDRTGVWTVTANGNTSGTKVYISLRIDWNNDGTFADYAGVKEIYMTSIVIGSPTSKAITIAYPDSYDGTSDMLNVRLVGGKTPESANMVSGRLVDGEVEDYFFTSSALLPIEFLSFTAEADGFDGLLEWEVSSELPNSHFEIERSIDGYVFNKIGQVEGKGSATEVERYAYTDVGVGKYVSGNVYYRLKQIDVDGEYKYSSQEVISFGLSRQMEIEIYPNPVREELYIHMLGKEDDRKITMEICGTQGKVLLTKDNFRGGMVKVEDLSPGVYMLKFTEGGKTVEYMKFIKM